MGPLRLALQERADALAAPLIQDSVLKDGLAPTTGNEAQATPWRAADSWACAACALIGLFLALAPHGATLARHGTLDYIQDSDEIVYLSVARAPYYGEAALRDPFESKEEKLPSLYSWMQFVPLAKLARWLGLSFIHMNMLWRILGGLAFGATLYFLFRRLFAGLPRAMAWSLGASLICLSDAGFIQARSLIRTLDLARHLWQGTTPQLNADAIGLYRVVTPLLNLPPLFLLVGVLVPAGQHRTREILLGSLLLGLLILTNFYFWTATVLGLALYLAAVLIAALRSRVHRPTLLARATVLSAVLGVGLALGAPQVLRNSKTFTDPAFQPILERLCKGQRLAPDHPVRGLYLKNSWAWGKIGVGAAGVLLFPIEGLGLLWCIVLAGFVLMNSALVTGLEFENFHWQAIHAPLGEIMLIVTVAWFLSRRKIPKKSALLWLLPGSMLLIAMAWRPYEALRAPEAVESSRGMAQMRPLKPSLSALGDGCILAGPGETRFALLFSQCALLYHRLYTAMSSLVPDADLPRRNALNAWLQGSDRAAYLASGDLSDRVGVYSSPQWDLQVLKQARIAAFDDLLQGLSRDALARYRPNALLLPAAAPTPRRGGPWTLRQKTEHWTLWTR